MWYLSLAFGDSLHWLMIFSCKLLFLGRGRSALFPPALINREFKALVLKSVQDPEGRAKISSLWCSLGKDSLSNMDLNFWRREGGKVRDGTKTGYILGKIMENFEVCSQWSWREGQHSCSTQPQKKLIFCTVFPPSCFSTIYLSPIQDNCIVLFKYVYFQSSSSQTNNILQSSIFLPSITDKFLALN